MIKVLIADDENNICKLIYEMIDWESFQMQVVGMAHDGIEALKIVKDERVDVLVTDIRMPGLSGIDLLRECRAYNPNIGIIVISGFSEFDYAKQALHYGAIDYILKPVNQDAMTKALNRLHEKFKEQENIEHIKKHDEINKNKARRDFFMQMLTEKVTPYDIQEINEQYQCKFKKGNFQVVAVKVYTPGEHDESVENYYYQKISQIFSLELNKNECYLESLIMPEYKYVFIINFLKGEELDDEYRHVFRQILYNQDIMMGGILSVGVGPIYSSLEEIPKSYLGAMECVHQKLKRGGGASQISFFNDTERSHTMHNRVFVPFAAALEREITDLNEEGVKTALFELKKSIETDPHLSGQDIIEIARGAINCFYLIVEKNGYELDKKERFLENTMKEVYNKPDITGIIIFLGKTFISELRYIKEVKKNDGSKIIRDVKQYIRQNLSKTITLEQLCDLSGYNASYFSTMFKKETGITVSSYITVSRIDEAKRLLRLTDKKVSAIASEVGYLDMKTFNKNFKKLTGIKPSEYRKVHQ